MSLRRVEPINGQCPDGFEYVRGHSEKSGTRVREFCRKIPEYRLKQIKSGSYFGFKSDRELMDHVKKLREERINE